ncbi:MAG: hypothetical protein RLZZ271_953 [Pseudomonadota bacterium]|jgi:sterol desaturase/sphingolipid hydroxylase (fatty acid hydroxylase superfamily)
MDTLVNWVLFVVFGVLYVLETCCPSVSRRLDLAWILRAGAINLFQLIVAFGAAYLLNDWLAISPLFKLPESMSSAVLGMVSFFVASFFVYWWHRFEHSNAIAWRIVHQLHHSPSRIEVLTANYAHPLDFLASTFISGVVAFSILGLNAQGAAWGVFYAGAVNYLAHGNISTPHWLGYLVQRPEMHRVHHRHNHHAQNYGLPLWDMLFSTWANPVHATEPCGFEKTKEEQLWNMLAGKDVHI